MIQLTPPTNVCLQRIAEHTAKMRRLVAVIAAASDMASTVEGTDPVLVNMQELLVLAEELAPDALAEAEWIATAATEHAAQLEQISMPQPKAA